MASPIRDEDAIVLKFGGGVNSRASDDEIDPRECSAGQNFLLDLSNRQLRNRPPFDLLGTAPNGAEIRGGANLLKSDGTVSMLVQAGANVYEWDGASFTLVGTVSASANLRGALAANSTLDDKVVITDLNLQEPVLTWDGTTLSTMSHNLVGTFLAKYCFISNERAFYGNVISNGTATPHMIVGAQREDFTTLSVSQRPASGLSEADPFYLLTPDLRPVNGIVEAFGVTAFSSDNGSVFKLAGASAKDFSIDPLHPRSGVSGSESMAFVGNDIAYGRQGRLESLSATDRFGDVETDDLSVQIADSIEGYKNWTTVYNSRLNRVYFLPSGENEIWVFQPSLAGQISPWSKWTTQHSMSFQPTFIMNMLDPVDGLEYVYCGDASGNFYRLEGTGTGDGGSANIKTSFTSKTFPSPLDADVFDVEGWIKYRQKEAATVTITLLWSGMTVLNEAITISIPSPSRPVYGGGLYYADGNYYGAAFADRITRQKFGVPGQSNEFQIKVEIEGTADFEINEIGIRFSLAS